MKYLKFAGILIVIVFLYRVTTRVIYLHSPQIWYHNEVKIVRSFLIKIIDSDNPPKDWAESIGELSNQNPDLEVC